MSEIREADRQYKLAVQRSNFRRKQLVQKSNRELRRLDKNFKEKKKEVKVRGDADLAEQTLKNKRLLAQDMENQEKILGRIQKSVQETKDMLASERARVAKTHEQQLDNIEKNFEKAYEESTVEKRQQLENQNFDTNKAIKEMYEKAQVEMDSAKRQFGNKKQEMAQLQQSELGKLSRDYHNVRSQSELEYNRALSDQRKLFDQKMHEQQFNHKKQMSKLNRENVTLLTQEKKRFEDQLTNYRADFQDKYTKLIKYHREQMDKLRDSRVDEINTMVTELSAIKSDIKQKGNDPFYRLARLDPQVIAQKDHYQIKLKIPEHEKDLVQISGKGRNMKVILSRSHRDSLIDAKNQTSDSIRRYESYTKELFVPEILDHTKVTKEYLDGHVIFKVKKA